MEHPKSLNLLVSTVFRALICPKRCKRMEISTSAFRGARRNCGLTQFAVYQIWTTQNVTGFKPPSFFPFRSSDVGNRKDVSYVVESLFCLSLVTESGERSMGSNLVTESGTPRTITCPKVESIQFWWRVVCVRFDMVRKKQASWLLKIEIFAKSIEEYIYMYTRLTLPEWPMEMKCEGANRGHSRHKTNIQNQHSPTQSLRRQTVSMHSRKRTENTWHKWIWVTYESYVWKSANMKSERELKLKLHFSDFQICLSVHLEAHPKHQEPEPYLAISRLQQQNEYGHTLHCIASWEVRGLKVSHHATCSLWKRIVDIENRNRHIERDVVTSPKGGVLGQQMQLGQFSFKFCSKDVAIVASTMHNLGNNATMQGAPTSTKLFGKLLNKPS